MKILLLVLVFTAILLPVLWPAKVISAPMLQPRIPQHAVYNGSVHRQIIGAVAQKPSMLLHCTVAQLENDGPLELLACGQHQGITAARLENGAWEERLLYRGLSAPAHLSVADLDGDGDQDIAVAVLGDLYPNDQQVGQVVLLEKNGDRYIEHRVPLLLRRVAGIAVADLDSDGDQDLIIAEFGHDHGSVRWLECTGPFTYNAHILHRAPGAIRVVTNDFDNDADQDFAVCISQHDEEVLLFINSGDGQFEKRCIFKSINYDMGMSGLVGSDIDQDGDMDLLLSCGDNLESSFHYPQPYHGCYVLRNDGDLSFHTEKIAEIPGCYACCSGDFDGDGDLDVAAVSLINVWKQDEAASLYVLLNDGQQRFQTRRLVNDPIQMVSCASADLNEDGRAEILTCCLHIFPPYERLGRLDVWELEP